MHYLLRHVNKLKIKSLLLLLLVLLLSATVANGQDTPEVHFGGTLRFNYNLSSWKEGHKARGGDFGYNLFRINSIAFYKVYTYVDDAAGKNHSWLGPEWVNALAQGTENANWHVRFNIDIGYYF